MAGTEDVTTEGTERLNTAQDPPEATTERLPVRQTSGERYRIADSLGKGGMGEVLDAHDVIFERGVAIKRMRAEMPSERQIERFLREAKIQGRLDHPSIVPVYELGHDADGRPYFVMKKLAARTLASLLDSEPRQRLLRAFTDVCNAVELAHTRGVIHRDLKPENIMLGEFGETYVIDWGVAKIVGEDDPTFDGDSHTNIKLTRAGTVIGTSGYMSPEQARGESDIDRRADVYALGCILREILTGRRRSQAILDGTIPPELEEIVVQATAAERDARIATAREIGDRIQRYLDGDRDLMARTALARTHLDSARAAFDRGDHVTALRDAARAIALDPHLNPAAELVTRVMLEPSKEVPAEVEQALDLDTDKVVSNVVKRIALTNLGYLGILPFFVGRVHPAYIAILAAIILVKIGVTWGMRTWGSTAMRYARLGLNMLILGLVARLCSPVVVVPGIATVTAVGLMSGTFNGRRDGAFVWGGLTLAVLVPWFLELAHVLSPTIAMVGDTLAIHAPLVATQVELYTLVMLQTAGLVLIAIITTHGLRLAERAARRQVRVQAWRLSQLVSSEGARARSSPRPA